MLPLPAPLLLSLLWFLPSDFGKYCTVSKSTIVRDQLTGESKGFGFIETPNMDEASKGLTGVHLTVLDGKVLSVEYAKVPDGSQPPPPRGPLGAGGARQYKGQTFAERGHARVKTAQNASLSPMRRALLLLLSSSLCLLFHPQPAFE